MNRNGKVILRVVFFLLLIFSAWVVTANVTSNAYASTFETEGSANAAGRLNEVVKKYVTEEKFSGSVLVAKGDAIILNEGYGYASRYFGRAENTADTRYLIGSMTKTLTAAAILNMEEKGLIRLDNRVTAYYPESTGWQDITIHHLLNHTSGIPNYWETPWDQARYFAGHNSPDAIIASYQDKPLLFTPGTNFDYSNTNYMILSGIIEKVSGQAYIDYVRENILIPHGLANTGYEEHTGRVKNLARGYCVNMVIEVVGFNTSNFYGAGGMYSTTEDFYRLSRALDMEKMVNETSRALIKDGIFYGYGMMGYDDALFGKTYHISGGGPGINGAMFQLVDRDMTIVVLSNQQEFDYEKLAADLYRATQGESSQ